VEEYNIMKCIRGMGEKMGGRMICEIGEIDGFSEGKKVVALGGVEGSVLESGKFSGTKKRISKRGWRRVGEGSYMGVRCGIGDCGKDTRR
ncbi:transposase, partial [Cytobacillus oceanisediminis]|uniref:transposase n=1 Tax=Cytobacillus oceanisediminis TaxID=665099 RepID=UPI0011A25A0A